MRKPILLILLIISLTSMFAQDVTFTFANPQNTNDGMDDFYEVDVLIESTAGFKLGAGLLYFNYNTGAFGSSIFTNGNITITHSNATTPSYLLGSEAFPNAGFYTSFITNDNTSSRVAFSWQQALTSGLMASNNVMTTAVELFHIQIKYVDINIDPGICFESSALFTNQTYTACGGGFVADCVTSPGVQITNDNFDCSGAALLLPVELIYFDAYAEDLQSRLEWQTANETNNKGFYIERMDKNDRWETIGFVEGQGYTSQTHDYVFYDDQPASGENYYRLKQMDFDGKFEYSDIRSVEFDQGQMIIEDLFPNPSISGRTTLKIWTPTAEKAFIEVYDLNGRQHSKNIYDLSDGWNGIDFQFNRHQSSLYLIHLNIGGQTYTKQLLISKD